MSCALTQGYTLDCRLNYGGVKEVYFIEKGNVISFTLTGNLITTITKVTAKLFRKYELIAHTADAEEAMSFSREMGTQNSKQSVKFPINKMATSVRDEILLLAQNVLYIVVVDENGKNWLYGKDYGMMLMTASAKTGKALGDRNGYELSFESDEKVLAYEVDAATLTSLTVAGA